LAQSTQHCGDPAGGLVIIELSHYALPVRVFEWYYASQVLASRRHTPP